MSDVKNVNFNTVFKIQEELEQDIKKLIVKYDGKMSLAQFIGVIEIVKFQLNYENITTKE